MNNALLYLGGILITALAVLFAVPQFVDWNSYRGIFEEEASRILGREVRVGGAVNVRLLPAPFVSFERLRIADTSADGGHSIIRVESFTMWLSVPPLLRGVLEAHRVELRRPVLSLAVNAEGSGNWRTLAIAPGTLPFAPKEVALQSVAIHDGAILISTPSRGELARFDSINGELNAEALEGPYKFRGDVSSEGVPRHVRIATAKMDDNGDLRFKAAVDVADNSYMLDARLTGLSDTPALTGELNAKLGRDAGAAKPAPSDADVTLQPEPSPPGALPSDAEGEQPAEVPQTAVAIDEGHGATGFELKAKVEGTALGVALSDISVSLEAGTTPQMITGEAKLSWADKTRLDVELASRWLDLDRLAHTGAAKMPLDAVRSYFELVAAQLPAEADTNARLQFDQLTLAGEPISNVHLAASRSGGPLELKGVRADLPGGVRLELEGVLTPRDRAPDLDGTLFVSGKSLMRFLAWGLGSPGIGRERNDGPFSLDGKFALGNGSLALTDAVAELSGTPLEGDFKIDLGERKRLRIAVEGPRIDVAQFGSGLVDLAHLRRALFGSDTVEDEGGAPSATQPFDPAGSDLSLDLKVAELIDGDLRLKDVDASIQLERGRLTIPHLSFGTADGLHVEAEGEASDVPAHPKGAVRGLVSAPNVQAAQSFLSLLGLETGTSAEATRIARLAPFRIAGTLRLEGGAANATSLNIDGVLGGGRISGSLNLAGGRAKWRTSPLDAQVRIESPDAFELVATLFDTPIRPVRGTEAQSGRVLIKAVGVPAEGLLSLAEITADGIEIGYRGQLRLPDTGDTDLDGEMKIAAPDVRVALAMAGLGVGDGAAGIPISGTVAVSRQKGTLKLAGNGLSLGDSTVSGTLAVSSAGDNGRRQLDASLFTDKASFAALLAPLLGSAREADVLAAAEASPRTASDETGGAHIVWPEQAFDLALLDGIQGKLSLEAGTLSLEPGLSIANARVAAETSPDGIKVTRLEGDAIGGRLTSQLEITRAPAGIGLAGSLAIDVASKPGGEADSTPAPSGNAAAFNVTFSSRALSPAAIVAGLTGTGTLAIREATLAGNSPAGVSAAARAALAGQGPGSDMPLADAITETLKDGGVKLGKTTIPVNLSDGALKLERVKVETDEGRSTFVTAVELETMRIDSEWQIEARLDKTGAAGSARAFLPPVTIVYAGKLKDLFELEPRISADALERELVVRKMELDVGELERLRKLDEERARQEAARRKAAEAERARLEAERRKALEDDQPVIYPNAVEREDLGAPLGAPDADLYDNSVSTGDPNGVPVERDIEAAAPPVAVPSPATAQRPPPRRRKPEEEEWRPFQGTPY